jgi:hypothetical protein
MSAQQPLPASASATGASATSAAALSRPILSSKPWRRGAFLLAGAAQLITISALLSVDPLPANWSALLLAIAPAPLAAAAAFTPRGVAMPAVAAAAVAILVGMIGGIGRTGSLFIPALVALVVGGVLLWRGEPG